MRDLGLISCDDFEVIESIYDERQARLDCALENCRYFCSYSDAEVLMDGSANLASQPYPDQASDDSD